MPEEEPISVLLIDPDQRSLAALSLYLSKQGCQVQATPSAKEGYIAALRDRPQAVIFDPRNSDLPGVELISRLRRDRRTNSIKCIAIVNTMNQAELTDLVSAGCDEYLVKSPEVLEKLSAALQKLIKTSKAQTQPTGGLLIVFLSAKGGTGTSSLCANLGHVIAKTNPAMDVILMDMVLPLGSLGNITGYEGEFNLNQASTHPLEGVDAAYLRRNMNALELWNMRLMAGPNDPEAATKIDASRIPNLIRAARQTFDLAIVDLGRSLSKISIPILQEADALVMITTPDLSTVTLSKKVWDYLIYIGVDAKKIYPILNRVVGLEGLSKSDVERQLGIQIQAAIPYMAGNFSLANNQHIPVTKRFPQDTAAMMLEQISHQTLQIARNGRK